MLTVIGTIPLAEGIYLGEARFEGTSLKVGRTLIPVERGTGALIASALRVLEHFGSKKLYCLLSGDQASGTGTGRLLDEACRYLSNAGGDIVVLHYMFVLIKYGTVIKETVMELKSKPFMIADAGGMYLAKASGITGIFDLLTPDYGEMAFLADPKALHPMYTRPEYFSMPVENLIQTAANHGNISAKTVIKGKKDLIYDGQTLIGKVTAPSIPAMEAIGGTGDTVTGLISAFQYLNVQESALKALLLNRLVGQMTGCTPRTQIGEFINNIDLSLIDKVGVEL